MSTLSEILAFDLKNMNAVFRLFSRGLGTLIEDYPVNMARINDGLAGTNGKDYSDAGYGACKLISLILDTQF